MKILNVNMSINSIYGGGTAERILQLSREFPKVGIDSEVLTLDLGLTEDILRTLKMVKVHSVPCLSERFFLPSITFSTLNTIKNSVRNVDLIHIMGHWSIINALAYIFARYFKKHYVFCPAGTLIIHGRSKIIKHIYNLIIGKSIIKNASAYIASTKDEVEIINKNGGINRKIKIITNGIESNNLPVFNDNSFRSKYKLGDAPFLLFIGTFSSIKGPDLLLKAFKRLQHLFPSYHLVFAGKSRGMLKDLKKYVINSELEKKVHFIGYLDNIDKYRAYHAADLLVVPSRSEVISMVALEAGLTATPVLITDKCGFNELSKTNGGIVVAATSDGIEKGLIEMLSSDNDKLKLMGVNLEKYVKENFTWTTIIKKYIKLFNQIFK